MFNQQRRTFGSMMAVTPAVKFLLILNVVVFILDWMTSPSDPEHRILTQIFALRANWWTHFRVAQLFTYMFIHGSFGHIFFNMLSLFFIGPTVERTIGSYRFFILYYVSGILGGLGWSLLADPYTVMDVYGNSITEYPICIGASGAVMGILGAFGALYPKAELLLWFVIPVRTWILVLCLTLWELYQTLGSHKIGGIANAAHLVGAIAGFSYAMSLKHPDFLAKLKGKAPGFGASKPKPRRPSAGAGGLSKEEIDHILDKIGKQGMGALTPREREMLKRATRG